MLDVNIDAGYLSQLIEISEKAFGLRYGESKTLELSINAKNVVPYSYIGKLSIKVNGITKDIPTIVNIKEKDPGLQAFIQIIKKILLKGEKLEANITLTKKDTRVVESKIYYFIKDDSNKVYFSKVESIKLGDRLEISKIFELPEDFEYQNYSLQIWLESENFTSIAEDSFLIVEKERPSFKLPLTILTAILVLLIVSYTIWKILKRKYFSDRIDLEKVEEVIEKNK